MHQGKRDIFALLFPVILLLCPDDLPAQHKLFELSGVVIDTTTLTPVVYASVTLHTTTDSSLVNGSVTNRDGKFLISNVPYGEYFLQVDGMGYVRTRQAFVYNTTQQSPCDTLYLIPSTAYLEAVAITAEITRQSITPEKTIIRVEQSAAGTTGSLYDLLKEQSNILIDADNKLYLRGNSNVRLMIDGQPAEMDMLVSLPASLAERVEIITNPDVTYEAEGSGGIINIITKQPRSKGFTGNARLSYGITGRVNGGFGIGFSRERYGAHLNYQGRYEETTTNSQLSRHLFNEGSMIEQEITSQQREEMHSAHLGFWFNPAVGHNIKLNIRSIFPQLFTNQVISGHFSNDTGEVFYQRKNEILFNRRNIDGTISYRRIYEKGKHEAGVDFHFSRTRGSRPASYYLEGVLSDRSEGGGAPTSASLQLFWLKGYGSSGRVDAGMQFRARWNEFEYRFFNYDLQNDVWNINPLFSNDLIHRELVPSG